MSPLKHSEVEALAFQATELSRPWGWGGGGGSFFDLTKPSISNFGTNSGRMGREQFCGEVEEESGLIPSFRFRAASAQIK